MKTLARSLFLSALVALPAYSFTLHCDRTDYDQTHTILNLKGQGNDVELSLTQTDHFDPGFFKTLSEVAGKPFVKKGDRLNFTLKSRVPVGQQTKALDPVLGFVTLWAGSPTADFETTFRRGDEAPIKVDGRYLHLNTEKVTRERVYLEPYHTLNVELNVATLPWKNSIATYSFPYTSCKAALPD